jgi:citronellol/citronellal dehydrogenase
MPNDSIFREGLFTDKTIIVTGGGTGIGRATARELAALGAHVILCSRALGHLEATRDEIIAAGGQASALRCNIRDPESIAAFFDAVMAEHGQIDGLVNNGGGQFLSPAEDIAPKGWNAVIDTNLTGTFAMSQAAFKRSLRDHGGAIVNIVMEMWRGMPGIAHSAAARAGVVNLTQTLALEWAQHGVRVNVVAPGIIDSSGLKNYGEAMRPALLRTAAETPAQRMGTESEVAAAIIFLLSPAATYVSGATLRVDGASSLYRLQGYAIPDHAPWPAHNTFTDADEAEG